MDKYPFSPLFTLQPAAGREDTAQQFTLGLVADTEINTSGTYMQAMKLIKPEIEEKRSDVSRDTLKEAMNLKRKGLKVSAIPVLKKEIQDLSDVTFSTFSSAHHNSSFDTLASSVDMLTPEEASKLSETNAPVMKKGPHFAKAMSVRSV